MGQGPPGEGVEFSIVPLAQVPGKTEMVPGVGVDELVMPADGGDDLAVLFQLVDLALCQCGGDEEGDEENESAGRQLADCGDPRGAVGRVRCEGSQPGLRGFGTDVIRPRAWEAVV